MPSRPGATDPARPAHGPCPHSARTIGQRHQGAPGLTEFGWLALGKRQVAGTGSLLKRRAGDKSVRLPAEYPCLSWR